jgi:hypothetical protein
MSSLVAHRFN